MAIPTVVIRDGIAYHGEDVDVIDLDFLGQTSAGSRSELEQADIDGIVAKLRAAGFDSAADEVEEWWAL